MPLVEFLLKSILLQMLLLVLCLILHGIFFLRDSLSVLLVEKQDRNLDRYNEQQYYVNIF